jgi:hypothetical protein
MPDVGLMLRQDPGGWALVADGVEIVRNGDPSLSLNAALADLVDRLMSDFRPHADTGS